MATVDSGTQGADAARNGLLTRYPLFLFFILSFVLTWGYFWLIWAPLRLPDSLIALGGFGPAASAFLVLALTSGKPECFAYCAASCTGELACHGT
jgi:hypothetical protein